MSIRILLADDHEIVRFGLCSLIEEQPDMEVVGEVENGRKAISCAHKLKPDIIIMDIAMPDMNGIEATRRIHKEYPDIGIIILSMYSKKKFIIDALKAGVSGYILKTKVYDDLILAIKAASAGEVYLSSKIAAIVAHEIVGGLPIYEKSAYTVLTPREREVLQLISEGKSTKQSALHLKISIKTIESTRRQIMYKLDIHNIADLTKYAISEGITSLDF
ncbi:MAG: response regulator transcription factor [Sedimentisphaerales bacterium]|nr:response regulator transcription factor [Sedimentisphaerales bacterium]